MRNTRHGRRSGLLKSLRYLLRSGAAALAPEARDALLLALWQWQKAHQLTAQSATGPQADTAADTAAEAEAEPELFKTLLALWVADALDAPYGRRQLRKRLEKLESFSLDGLARASYACLMAHTGVGRRLRLIVWRDAFNALLSRLGDQRALFVWAVALELCGWSAPWFLLAWWAPWNWESTGEAAAVLALQALAGASLRRGQRANAWILDQQLSNSAFRSNAQAPRADLQASALALGALRLAGWRDEEHATHTFCEWLERCQGDNGHWRRRPDGAEGEIEESFCALLALGAAKAK